MSINKFVYGKNEYVAKTKFINKNKIKSVYYRAFTAEQTQQSQLR